MRKTESVVDGAAGMLEEVQSVAEELGVDREEALKLVELHQRRRILDELKDIEIHTKNILRTGAKQRSFQETK